MVLEEVDAREHDVGAVRDELLPVRAARRGDGRRHEPEVAAAGVRPDVEEVAAVLDVVLVVLLARGDERPLALGRVGLQDAGLRGRVAGALHHDPRAAPRAADADVEPLVLLLVEQGVGGRGRPDLVPVDAVRALRRLVLDGVEEGLPVRGPRDARDAQHPLGKERARLQVLHGERVLAEARVVRRVREEAPVVRRAERAEGHELLPLGERVQVEEDLLGAVPRGLPAVDPVLLPLLRPVVVQERAVAVGDGQVRLLHVGEHLVVERLLERLGRLEDRVGVRVLGLEIGRDLRVRLLAQPEVRVGPRVAVQEVDLLHLLRHWWSGRNRRRLGWGVGGGDGHGGEDEAQGRSAHGGLLSEGGEVTSGAGQALDLHLHRLEALEDAHRLQQRSHSAGACGQGFSGQNGSFAAMRRPSTTVLTRARTGDVEGSRSRRISSISAGLSIATTGWFPWLTGGLLETRS